MELALNNVALAVDGQPMECMDVQSFVETFHYNIDKLYIDKFWNSTEHNKWLVIDYDMLKWMGYDNNRDIDKKMRYLKLLQRNFESDQFDQVSGRISDDDRLSASIGTNNSLKKNTIIVSADTFKLSLMMLRTRRAKTIRQYYLTLEKIFRDYITYTQFVKDHNHEVECAMLRDQPATPVISINRTDMRADRFVYFMTSKQAFSQCLFKIGRSNNPQKRLVQHNCASSCDMDRMFYTHVIPCIDDISLEKLLHKLLVKYHSHQEWYKIPHAQLKRIINIVKIQQQTILSEINACIREKVDKPNNMTLDEFCEEQTIQKLQITDGNDNPEITTGTCALCDSPIGNSGCDVCNEIPENILDMVRNGDAPSFNSNKHSSLSTMIRDRKYCSWLLKRFWFRTKPEYVLVSRLHGRRK